MAVKLTKRQQSALDIIQRSLESDGHAPTLSELMEEMEISTKKGVAFHLDALEKKGFIFRTGEARGIRLVRTVEDSDQFIRVPLLGYANAGQPLVNAEEEFIGELTVDRKILKPKRKVFGVEIKGDSMNSRMVNGVPMENGNYAIIAKETDVHDGDIVLALVNGGATVKTFKKKRNMAVLYPESTNKVHKPIYIKDAEDMILGKVVTVLHNPQADKKD